MPLKIDSIEYSASSPCSFFHPDYLLANHVELNSNSRAFAVRSEKLCKDLSESHRVLYVGQSELATICSMHNPHNLRYLGSDDATTCHIVVLKDPTRGNFSLAHLDGTETVAALSLMIEELDVPGIENECGAVGERSTKDKLGADPRSIELELYMFGGFVDAKGYSEKLFTDLLSTCAQLPQTLHLKLACCYRVNTVPAGGRPIVYGIAIDVASGEIFSARHHYKGPDELLRHARLTAGGVACDNFSCYDNHAQTFIIRPAQIRSLGYNAKRLLTLPDDAYLNCMSTSPNCEPEDFVRVSKNTIRFILEHPDLNKFFIRGARRYSMDDSGKWILIE